MTSSITLQKLVFPLLGPIGTKADQSRLSWIGWHRERLRAAVRAAHPKCHYLRTACGPVAGSSRYSASQWKRQCREPVLNAHYFSQSRRGIGGGWGRRTGYLWYQEWTSAHPTDSSASSGTNSPSRASANWPSPRFQACFLLLWTAIYRGLRSEQRLLYHYSPTRRPQELSQVLLAESVRHSIQ